MGTTLQNGVYLPNEGERNCYAGLKTNWEILDQKVADVIALQQAVAGALHREIVESLPTTDIDPNTIYMILSGTSATENVYNEYMYVNNAWELIGTSATDLTNYYTKAEVDGKLLLKANDSDVVHKSGNETVGGVKSFSDDIIRGLTTIASRTIIGNGNTPAIGSNGAGYIQNKAILTYQDSTPTKTVTVTLEIQDSSYTDGRRSAFYPNSNNTTNLGKSGKRWAGVYATNYYYGGSEVEFSQKFVTTDTAQTISGNKIFEGVNINLKSTTGEYGVSGGGLSATYLDKNSVQLAQIKLGNYTSGISYNKFSIFAYDSNNQLIERTLTFGSSNNALTVTYFRPDNDSIASLGTTGNRWSKVYAMSYYYGNDNVEFSTKFVTTDTNQTISGDKTFNGNTNCVGELNQTAPFKMTADTSFTTGSKNTSIYDQNGFQCANDQILYNNNKNIRRAWIVKNNSSGTNVSAGFYFSLNASGLKALYPTTDSDTDNGSITAYWRNTYTKNINGVEPSSLSLPSGNASDVIDISSYITVLDGTPNSYTVPANGWISITVVGTAITIISSSWSDSRLRASSGKVRILYPVLKGQTVYISIYATTLDMARFIPCQGNV